MVKPRHALVKWRLNGRIPSKLESLNPVSSKKDCVALEIVREAWADGSLRAGQAVVEVTRGNTGTGLAIDCHALGHSSVAASPGATRSSGSARCVRSGPEVVLVDQAPGSIPGQVSKGSPALVGAGIRWDQITDRAALMLQWSIGPVEGQVDCSGILGM